jgi:thymidylate synthase ThyX
MILRMRAHPLPEARIYADLMLKELRKVIPSFLARVDREDRGIAQSAYMETNRVMMEEASAALFANDQPESDTRVTLTDFDPEGENKVIAAMLYPHTHVSESQILDRVQRMTTEEKQQIVRAYVGQRTNRCQRPGRAFERVSYRFDICSDYGAFRDLQRHRLLTIEWQSLSPHYGFNMPGALEDAGLADRYTDSMERSASLYEALFERFPNQSQYALALAHRIRYSMQFNAREAMHMLELRSGPAGHPEYRGIAQEMHTLIAEQAGHKLIAEAMMFVDHEEYALGRIDAERRTEQRRNAAT